MGRRLQLIPWKTAGRVSEQHASADEVVRQTGWVFNNETGSQLTLDEFVATGDNEMLAYLDVFGLRTPGNAERTVVEIGCGIGRMTCAFTREFATVYACDLDAGFLERCRETVARFGKVDRLRTIEVADGRIARRARRRRATSRSATSRSSTASIDDALALAGEAVRVVQPGGHVALNFRSRSGADALLLPAGALIRSLFRIPGFGRWLSQRRTIARLAWQANRLAPTPSSDRSPTCSPTSRSGATRAASSFGTGADDRHVRRHQPQPLVARRAR